MGQGSKTDYIEYILKNQKSLKVYSFKMFNIKIFSFYYHNRFGWFRVFGRGLKWKDTSKHNLLFSERYRYEKGIYIGKWRIAYLPKPFNG